MSRNWEQGEESGNGYVAAILDNYITWDTSDSLNYFSFET